MANASSNHKTVSPRPALGSHISVIQNIQRHAASQFFFTTRESGTGMDSIQVHSLWVLLYCVDKEADKADIVYLR